MTAAEITNGLTQTEYEKLLSRLAGAIQTQRRFITIINAERKNDITVRYIVKCNGAYYPYLIEDIAGICVNFGVII